MRVTANDENTQRHSDALHSNSHAAFYPEHGEAKRLNKSARNAIAANRHGKPEV
jgi:hypothetical protein